MTAPGTAEDTSQVWLDDDLQLSRWSLAGAKPVDLTWDADGMLLSENLHSSNTLKDGSTLDTYRKMLPDGRQAWAEVRRGEITNGGVNDVPK